ncbi:MAG: carbon storage regulator [Clostridiaceae bacterium]|nr:carbon storage regulator [Clostridiaceae bacterium]
MLVISRKPGESLIIGDGLRVTVFEVSGDRVKIGIEAPRDISIVRAEVLETKNSNIEAVKFGGAKSIGTLGEAFQKLIVHKDE